MKILNERYSELANWCDEHNLSLGSSRELDIILEKIMDDVDSEISEITLIPLRIVSVLSRLEAELNGNYDGAFLTDSECYEARIKDIWKIVDNLRGKI